jgi:hypothetical protein
VTTGVTVTENIYDDVYDLFDVHVWDTSQNPTFTLIAQVLVPSMPLAPQPEPLNLCAQVAGNVVQFVAWTSGAQPPTWDASVTQPTAAPTSRSTGFYAGHIPSGTSSTYR